MKTKKVQRRLSRRGAYALGVVVDVDFRTEFDLQPGDAVLVYRHARNKRIMCVEIPAKK